MSVENTEEFAKKTPNQHPPSSIEKKGAEIGANALAQLERTSNMREDLNDYLRDDPQLRNHIEGYKKDLIKSLKDFAQKTKGTVLEKHAAMLVQDIEAHFEEWVISLFTFTGIKNNPELKKRILANKKTPIFEIQELKPGYLGITENIEGGMQITIAPLNSSYEDFVETIVHEFAHAYIESMERDTFVRNTKLNEGITEFIAVNSVGKKPTTYHAETDLASTLFALDKDALMDWYTGGSNETFKEKLISALENNHTPEEAAQLADAVINMSDDSMRRNVDHYMSKYKMLMDLFKNRVKDVEKASELAKTFVATAESSNPEKEDATYIAVGLDVESIFVFRELLKSRDLSFLDQEEYYLHDLVDRINTRSIDTTEE